MKRWLSWILCTAALLVVLPAGALAAEEPGAGDFEFEKITDSGGNITSYRVVKFIGTGPNAVIPERFQGRPVVAIGKSEGASEQDSAFRKEGLNGYVKIPHSVQTIESFAFAGSKLSNIVIPGSVNTIGEKAFYKCGNLTRVDFQDYVDRNGKPQPGHTTIGKRAFAYCAQLKDLTLPNSVSVIETGAFQGCGFLVDVVFPASVVQLKKDAFADCEALRNVTFLYTQVTFGDDAKTPDKLEDVFPFDVLVKDSVIFHGRAATYSRIKNALTGPGKITEEDAEQKYIHEIEVDKTRNGSDATGWTKDVCSKENLGEGGTNGTVNGRIELKITCKGYDEVVPVLDKENKPVTGEDGEPVTEKKHRDCTRYNNGNTYSESREISASYHNEVPKEDKKATCTEPGYTNRTKCSICGIELYGGDPGEEARGHRYSTKKAERVLIEGFCGTETKDLILITATCDYCDYTPECYHCVELEKAWKEVSKGLEEAKKELTEASTKKDEAQKALEEAQKALEEAQKALEDAEKTKTEAESALEKKQTAYASVTAAYDKATNDRETAKTVQDQAKADKADAASKKADAEKALEEAKKVLATLEALEGADLTAAQQAVEDAEQALEVAEQVLEDANKVLEAADKAVEAADEVLEKLKPVKEAADQDLNPLDEAVKAAEKAITEARNTIHRAEIVVEKAESAEKKADKDYETAKEKVDGKTDGDKGADAAFKKLDGELRDHVLGKVGADPHAEKCARCAELEGKIAKETNGSIIKDLEDELAKHKKGDDLKDIEIRDAISGKEAEKAPAHDWGEPWFDRDEERPACGSGETKNIRLMHTCKICGTEKPTGEDETYEAAEKHQRPTDAEIDTEKSEAATCTTPGKTVYKAYICTICGHKVEAGETEIIDALNKNGHTRPVDAEIDTENSEPATCQAPGKTVYKPYKCTICGEQVTALEERTVKIPQGEHKLEEQPDVITEPATCTTTGLKNTGMKKCTNPGCDYVKIGEENVVIPPLGHEWGGFVPNPGQDGAQAEDCAERTVTGTVSCEREGCGETGERTITIPGKMSHNWDEWAFDTEKSVKTRTCKVCGKTEEQPLTSCAAHTWGSWTVITEPTSAAEGLRKHVCRVCGAEETVKIPATGGSAADPGPSKPDPNAEYTVTVTSGSGGTARVSRTSAKAGTSVTVTVSPHSGFEVDMIRVTGSATAKDLTGSQRSFTMPASDVNVTVSFSPIDSGSGWGGASNGAGGDPARSKDNTPVQITPQSIPRASAWGQIFSDIPTGHWAAGEINWANRMGYMNGTEGRFNPDEAITCQQMWMVLARLTGSYPANMADARRWAVEGGFADGSSPTAPVARHQLVTALYRCAYLKGGVSRSNASLAGYADSRVVPSAARDAFAWAVANGIVSGTSGNRLEPNGTLTRAQFAVILYRYSQRV